ncbi:hypothetical protein [Catellatospora tritici]|uniref:hypothetical protein n=1 Tax=Catellatospora tritici TaxID=2851566 RepID=UPI001C2DE0AC|nr:hypothetical protein [Catellatospora tritici]MBV1854954.1 hypothetical protein [Catellatospora tritici]
MPLHQLGQFGVDLRRLLCGEHHRRVGRWLRREHPMAQPGRRVRRERRRLLAQRQLAQAAQA